MSARVDAVCSRVQTAITLKAITGNMASVVKSMDAAAKSMDLEKMVKLMDQFEKNFENLDVQSQVMDSTMGNTVTLSVPDDQVSGLMKKVADEAGLELNDELPKAAISNVSVSATEEDDLTQRLARLRQYGESSATVYMENQLFNLKFAAKSLEREAVRCEKVEREEQSKIKNDLKKGNSEGARIHAENAIRNKNQALSYRRMSARVDAVCSRVQTAITLKAITGNMASVVKSMDAAAKSMDLEKMVKLMDQFEKNFENLDVQSQVMDSTMGNTVTLSVPDDQVSGLMKKVADEAGLELNDELPKAAISNVSVSATEEDDLTQRLARLRQV
ncbi:hypothetical protein AHF37_07403 [Paragonimus kellicotti]|nr:hypothetical protein AHF37_07403 [Paragonimus kellicotti]